MTTIISQRHFFRFYIAIFFIDLFWGLMSLATGALYSQGTTLFGRIIMIVMSAGLAFMVFYTIFRYYKNAPRIVVNDNSISFNSKIYYWRDLEKMEMTGKRSFRFMGERKEGMLFKFIGEKERYIFDDTYENSPEIKSEIEKVTNAELTADNNKAVFIDNQVIDNDIIENDTDGIKFYKGNPLFSFTGIMLWGLIVFFICMGCLDFSKNHHTSSVIMMSILSLLCFILLANRFHYFGVTTKSLIIKSYNFLWIKSQCRLADIREIVFEQKNKRPITLRVINKDFTNKTYPAATLWGKKWIQLKADLESKGVKVRNECVIEDDEPIKFKFFND